MNSKSENPYPPRMFATPEEWGDYTTYCSKEEMEDIVIPSLWGAGIEGEIEQCTEKWELLQVLKSGDALYERVQNNHKSYAIFTPEKDGMGCTIIGYFEKTKETEADSKGDALAFFFG